MDKGLLISIRNVGLKAKNSKARLQEGVLEMEVANFTYKGSIRTIFEDCELLVETNLSNQMHYKS